MTTRRILITGGAGFIGFHLASHLAAQPGSSLLLVDNFRRGARDEELAALSGRENVDILEADLTDPAAYARFGGGFDEVYHLAGIVGVRNVAKRPDEVLRVNTLGTFHLLQWFVDGGGRKVVFASTSEVYAWTQHFYALPVPTPENVPLAITEPENPRSAYAASKMCGELAVRHVCAAAGKAFTIVRYHNVYGPRMGHDHVIPELFRRARAGENPLTVYSADHRRAFCYQSDAVRATVAAMRSERADGQVVNIGNDREEVTIRDLAEAVLRVARIEAALHPANGDDPVRRRCPDLSTARRLLDYEPEVNLEAGLLQTIPWYSARA